MPFAWKYRFFLQACESACVWWSKMSHMPQSGEDSLQSVYQVRFRQPGIPGPKQLFPCLGLQIFCFVVYVILTFNMFTVDMYLTSKRQTTFLMIKCIKSLKLKRSALLSDKIINKMASSCFSGNNLNVTFPKVEGCAYWNVNIKVFFLLHLFDVD